MDKVKVVTLLTSYTDYDIGKRLESRINDVIQNTSGVVKDIKIKTTECSSYHTSVLYTVMIIFNDWYGGTVTMQKGVTFNE